MNPSRTVTLLLRIGVAVAFLFPALNAFFDPYSWIGYFPSFLSFIPDLLLLHTFGLIEIAIGVWLLSGQRIFIPSVVATVFLGLIIIFNLSDFQVLFRDVSIACMSLALAVISRPRERTPLA